ncbi:Mitochondrial matrix iron chaperone [Coemansia sp. RSA 1722]|nr:Mitochondrial matrix iron chaperone [Coemansia sp. RSA 1721]KAJ2606774.1 Mitochondrial matrix iron chaperone [Coemansia sp. RSA 1722]KAJ2638856.1 Mitochondrial matrix iron chaperone [Coemansia sp. RSA 1286]
MLARTAITRSINRALYRQPAAGKATLAIHTQLVATKATGSLRTKSAMWWQRQQQQHQQKPNFSTASSSLFSHTKSVQAKKYTMVELDDSKYHNLSSQAMDSLTEYFEDLGDQLEMDDYDIEYTSGVLTLRLGVHGTYVINKQPPNKQIWLSSPISGPERYDYDETNNAWFCRHKDESLGALLNQEISEALAIKAAVPIN